MKKGKPTPTPIRIIVLCTIIMAGVAIYIPVTFRPKEGSGHSNAERAAAEKARRDDFQNNQLPIIKVIQRGDVEGARKMWAALVARNPEPMADDLRFQLAKLLVQKGYRAEAKAHLEAIMLPPPNKHSGFEVDGRSMLLWLQASDDSQDVKAAFLDTWLDKVHARLPWTANDNMTAEAEANCLAGRYYMARCDYTDAQPYFDRAVSLSPNSSRAFSELALNLQLRGNRAGSKQAYSQALSLSTDPAEQKILEAEMNGGTFGVSGEQPANGIASNVRPGPAFRRP